MRPELGARKLRELSLTFGLAAALLAAAEATPLHAYIVVSLLTDA